MDVRRWSGGRGGPLAPEPGWGFVRLVRPVVRTRAAAQTRCELHPWRLQRARARPPSLSCLSTRVTSCSLLFSIFLDSSPPASPPWTATTALWCPAWPRPFRHALSPPLPPLRAHSPRLSPQIPPSWRRCCPRRWCRSLVWMLRSSLRCAPLLAAGPVLRACWEGARSCGTVMWLALRVGSTGAGVRGRGGWLGTGRCLKGTGSRSRSGAGRGAEARPRRRGG